MYRTPMLALSVVLAGCSIGAPPGFSGGDSWSFPLVGPLEDSLLMTPVFIHDKGPYLMAIDPDSMRSVVDQAIVSELDLRSSVGGKILDETDTNRQLMMAEVLRMRLGTLTVRSRNVGVMKVGSFSIGGRQVRGVIGRDVIADSLVFGFDRERGQGYLATQKGFTPPVGASTIGYDVITNRLATDIPPVSRRVAKIEIDGKAFKLHLDLGATTSQLRESLWSKVALTAIPAQNEVRDEAGTVRTLDHAAVAGQVSAGGVSAGGVLLVPYGDKRWESEFIDGTLGLNFFRTLNVWANWDASRFFLVPRGDVVATAPERVKRWGNAVLDGCAELGCVELQLIEPPTSTSPAAPTPSGGGAPGAGGPPGASVAPVAPRMPRPVLVVTRDASAKGLDLEITVGAIGASGQPTDLPRLVINLPVGTDNLSNQLDPSYSGTKLVVLDVSPYPRQCSRGAGCIAAFASPP